MKRKLSDPGDAASLVSLDAVVFDTEATGPNPARDRVIQIGAVRISGGVIDKAGGFSRLIDPGVPIPENTTRIHGITDSDVKGQSSFAAVYEEFLSFCGGAVLIGHSIGYDLALFKRECGLAGIEWRAPRALDTRMLARVARPAIGSGSLEALAGWLGVSLAGRHTALGDASATAAIFLALLPHLRERGVRTLAEAEARCRALGEEAMPLHEAGWEDPLHASAARAEPALARIDAYPYSHRVGDVMSAEPVFVEPGMRLSEVNALLMDRHISSVFVGTGEQVRGIVTERDILRAIAAGGGGALMLKASDIMSGPLESVRADAFIYRAIGRMTRLRVRHLGVVDEAGRVVGALSARDLLRLRAGDALMLGDEIELAGDGAALAAAWARVPQVAEQLVAEDIDARMIAAVISWEICAITRRAAELAEAAMRAEGRGGPPAPYAVMVLGSGGRGESLLAADQDNAIVYDCADEEGSVDDWFARLGELIAQTLDVAGIQYCKGGIMASNKAWRRSVGGWLQTVGEWVRKARPEDLLNVDIFFDLRPVHGDHALAERILEEARRQSREAPAFLKLLAQTASEFRPPLGFMGRLQTENGRVDLKKGGLLPVVTLARVLALRHGVDARSTPDRLAGLSALGLGALADFEALTNAHGLVLGHILGQQIADMHAGQPLSNSVDAARLGRAELAAFRQALSQLTVIDQMMQDLLFAQAT